VLAVHKSERRLQGAKPDGTFAWTIEKTRRGAAGLEPPAKGIANGC
jgi:hypothetical protein